MLIGRSAECGALGRLVEEGRAGRSGALVLRGEAGVGKTALLRYAIERADSFHVLRATGLETESELAFAALHQVLARELDRLDCLPDPQADALRSAFGLAPARGSNPFLISVALLGLLADLAEETPVLCVVDDAHWLDDASASALLFAARRIEAERIAMIFAAREGDARTFDAPGLESLVVEGLDDDAARALLDERAGARLAPSVRERLVEQTGGNALALLELPTTLTEGQLSGREPLAEPLPIGAGLQVSYLARLRRLPEATQSLLLVAAAEDSGDLTAILRAADTIDVGREALPPAEREGLVDVLDGRLTFRHPLVRSAVYRGATFTERQLVHRALAEVQDDANADRRAWHRAAAAEAPDEEIACGLELSAERATLRGGYAAAATALEKAAALSPEQKHRTLRLLSAADAAWLAGRTERARALVADAARLAPADQQVDVTKLQGKIEVRSGVFDDALAMLLSAAQALASTDPATALRLLFEAEEATIYTGNTEAAIQIGLLVERLAAEAPEAADPVVCNALVGFGRVFAGRADEAAPLLLEALAGAKASDDPDQILTGLRAANVLGDDLAAVDLGNRAVRIARERSALGALPRIFERLPFVELRLGRYTSARVNLEEGLRLARETRQETGAHLCQLALVAAIQGREDECRACAAEAIERALERQAGVMRCVAMWALGLLELGLGRPEEAFAALGSVLPAENVLTHKIVSLFLIPDYIEAAARSERLDAAGAAFGAFEEWATAVGQPWALALVHHCRGLLASGEEAERALCEALALHPESLRPFEHARTQLALGETLRRLRRRRDAREHLRAAISAFHQLGAAPWEERAGAELRASGETARRREPGTLGDLTPQELQIARLVAGGARNRDVAAQLFLSPRTIDYHLRKVFMKLGISSRAELARSEVVSAGP
jgi:DNA-binding CsgD family transcriptional regulator